MFAEAAFMRQAFPTPPDQAWYDNYALPAGWALIADKLPGAFVLDIGCASGWVAYHARKAGARVIASDIFETYVHPSLPFLLADKEHLPFADGTFDLVLTSNVLHHGNLAQTVLEACRVLKSEGIFVSFTEPCIPEDVDEQSYLHQYCRDERESGIDERRPTLLAYESAFEVCFALHWFFAGGDPKPYQGFEYHGALRIEAVK